METRPGGTSKNAAESSIRNCKQTSEHFKAPPDSDRAGVRPKIALSERRFTDAEKISASVVKKATSAGYKEYPPIAISTQGIAKVMTGQTKEGLKLCNDSVSLAQGMADSKVNI